MGSRANANLGYGIYWDHQSEVFQDYEKLEQYEDLEDDLNEAVSKIDSRLSVDFIRVADEAGVFLLVKDSRHYTDWDYPKEVDVNKLIIDNSIDEAFLKVCHELDLNYEKPSLQLIAGYF